MKLDYMISKGALIRNRSIEEYDDSGEHKNYLVNPDYVVMFKDDVDDTYRVLRWIDVKEDTSSVIVEGLGFDIIINNDEEFEAEIFRNIKI